MLTFQLFRIRVELPSQPDLFNDSPSRRVILERAIGEKPSEELRHGFVWHIGNLIRIDPDALYFALGRTTISIVERYDEERRDFLVEPFESAPYTHVVLDERNQVIAIAGKSRLAPTIRGIAAQFQKLLNSSAAARDSRARIRVDEISDPEDFISILRTAYSVEQFSVTFRRPNPFDVEEDFHRPLEKLLQESDGEVGKTTISGENLNAEVLAEVARSTAATGDDAAAKLRMTQEEHLVRRKLKGQAVTLAEEGLDTDGQKRNFLGRLRDAYSRVRHRLESKE